MELVAKIIDAQHPTSVEFLVSTSSLKLTSKLVEHIVQVGPASLTMHFCAQEGQILRKSENHRRKRPGISVSE